MLFFLLLLTTPAQATIETRVLECAKHLARANEWVVPMAGYQSKYSGLYHKERNLLHLWSKKNPRNVYFYAADKLYVVEAPAPVVKPRMVNWNYFVAGGVPGGDLFLRYNASSLFRDLRTYSLDDPKSRQGFSDQRAEARPATAEEEKEALGLYLDYMGYLWEMRESVKNPSWVSYISNAGKGTTPPNAEEIQAMESACAVFFSPEAELSCRK
jgi:hypothetical protein